MVSFHRQHALRLLGHVTHEIPLIDPEGSVVARAEAVAVNIVLMLTTLIRHPVVGFLAAFPHKEEICSFSGWGRGGGGECPAFTNGEAFDVSWATLIYRNHLSRVSTCLPSSVVICGLIHDHKAPTYPHSIYHFRSLTSEYSNWPPCQMAAHASSWLLILPTVNQLANHLPAHSQFLSPSISNYFCFYLQCLARPVWGSFPYTVCFLYPSFHFLLLLILPWMSAWMCIVGIIKNSYLMLMAKKGEKNIGFGLRRCDQVPNFMAVTLWANFINYLRLLIHRNLISNTNLIYWLIDWKESSKLCALPLNAGSPGNKLSQGLTSINNIC